MPAVEVYPVQAQGIGRVDYSQIVERTTEAFITSWQNSYNYFYHVPNIPAGGSLLIDIPLNPLQVVILYDFFASIPSNQLIHLIVQVEDMTGAIAICLDKTGYQTIIHRISKGVQSINHIYFTVENYAAIPETNMLIGCSGMYTSMAEFTLDASYVPPP